MPGKGGESGVSGGGNRTGCVCIIIIGHMCGYKIINNIKYVDRL